MRTSESTKSIFQALWKAQKLTKQPKKTKKAYNYMYAPLDEVWDCIREPMEQAGLMLLQVSHGFGEQYGLYTKITHVESGEWVESFIPLDAKADPQDAGTALTYFRRYSINNLFNLVAEDDIDGVKPSNSANASRGVTSSKQTGSNFNKPVGATSGAATSTNAKTTNVGGSLQGIPKLPQRPQTAPQSVNQPVKSNAERAREIKNSIPKTDQLNFNGDVMNEADLPF